MIFFKKVQNLIEILYLKVNGNFIFKVEGFCPCCEQKVTFIARNPWLRDYFKCTNCNSIPRERALMQVIKQEYPNWKNLIIHESSPGNRGHSLLLKKKAVNYTETQFYPEHPLGSFIEGIRNEDLERQTFDDNSFDLVITSDVMEHVYEPEKAFKEIYRTLKPGGAHIFSVPLVNKHEPTQRWAERGENNEPIFLHEPEWHSNPVDKMGSPVTMHWGYDIKDFIENCTEAESKIIYIDDLNFGIRAEFIEIVLMKKK